MLNRFWIMEFSNQQVEMSIEHLTDDDASTGMVDRLRSSKTNGCYRAVERNFITSASLYRQRNRSTLIARTGLNYVTGAVNRKCAGIPHTDTG